MSVEHEMHEQRHLDDFKSSVVLVYVFLASFCQRAVGNKFIINIEKSSKKTNVKSG